MKHDSSWALRRVLKSLGRYLPLLIVSLVLAAASGAFGLSFGALMSAPYWVTGGPWAALSWWISGIPADLLHCGGNFVLALVLADPLYQVLCKLRDKVFR